MGNGAMKTEHSNNNSPEISLNTINNMTLQEGRTYNMERMKKMLSSPISRKKNIAQPPPSNHGNQSVTTATTRYIGTPLPELVKRENSQIPHLVTKVCLYIYKNGMELEGVFRVNGNSRVVERLRSSFDQTGDADLEEAGDVMAVAGLLKLFLRELPDGLIPEQLTKTFVSVQEDYASDHETCLVKLRSLLEQLPRTEYEALKYIASFLVLLAKQAAANKMNPMALGIVFGPNLFRCSGGIQGLKDQGITNHIALKFITCYDRLFLEDGEMSPNSPGFVLKTPVLSKKVAPPRPPQPTVEANMPIPSPRKSKNKPNGTISHHLHIPRLHLNPELIAMTTESGNHSDEDGIDTNRSNSPFTLESDRSEFSALMSPRVPPPHNQALDSVISSAVKELLFGDSTSGHSSDDSTNSQNKCAPVAAPRRKRRQGDQAGGSTEKGELERQLSVKDRITRLQAGDGLTDSREDGRPKKQRPTSKAFEMFEKQGLVIGMAPADFSSSLRANEQQQQASDDNSSSESSGRESPNQPAPVAKNPPPKRPSSPPRIQQPSSEERVPQFGDMYENSHIILPAES